jgi:type I restriction enzyme S subunit
MDACWVNPKIIDDMLVPDLYQEIYRLNYMKIFESGFPLKKLSQISSNIFRGFTPENIEGENKDRVCLLKTVNIQNNELDLQKVFSTSYETYKENSKYHVEKNDVLITIMGATDDVIGRCWAYNNINSKYLFSDGVAIIKNVNGIDLYYLSTFLNSKIGHLLILQWNSGSTRKYITNERLSEIKIPFPPKLIQEYIGNKVRRAEKLREEAKRLKKEAEDKLITTLKFYEINEILNKYNGKHNWISHDECTARLDADYYKSSYSKIEKFYSKEKISLTNLEELVSCIYTGMTPPEECICEIQQPIKFLRVDNIKDNGLDFEDVLYIRGDLCKKMRLVKHRSVLVSIAGTIGNAAVVNVGNCTTNQNIAAIEVNNKINPYYLSSFLNCFLGKLFLDRVSTQATVKYINNEFLRSIKIPQIDMTIQIDIENIISKVTRLFDNSRQLIAEAKQDVEDLIEGMFDESKINGET